MIPGKREPKVLTDYRLNAREKLLNREEVIEEAEARYGPRKVLEPYFPRMPLPAGAPESVSGTQVAFEELDADLQALILAGGGGGTGGVSLRYTGTRVPNSGVRYLRIGQNIFVSDLGDVLTGDGQLIGISVAVDQVDAARDFQVEILRDPEGAATVLATLALPANQRLARDRTYTVPVTGLATIGARVVRTSGAGRSTFRRISVLVEVTPS